MSISLRPEHLKRYKDLALLLMKYGRSDLTRLAGLDRVVRESELVPEHLDPKVEELPKDLERLGPTYVKLGQFLSTRSDVLPPEYLTALERLQDSAEQIPYEIIEQIVSAELGVRISRAYLSFERAPLAAASLAQVHRAVLMDGRQVAVKVQRPGIRMQIVQDLDAFEDVAEFLDKHTSFGRFYNLQATLAEFRKALLRELDFRQEAQNLNVLGNNLREFELIIVPAPVDEYTTSNVLTMDYISGEKVTTLSTVRSNEVNGSRLADELFRAYLKQFLIDGFYHADPHPGNVFLTDDNRIALLDLGMIARLSEPMQDKLLRLLLAIAEGKAGDAVEYATLLGERTPEFDEQQFSKGISELVMRYQQVTIDDIEVGRVVLEVFKLAGASRIRLPSELAMLGKSLLNLDKIGRSLDPGYDPNAAIRRYSSALLKSRIKRDLSMTDLYEIIMESKEFFQQFPKRVNKLMTTLSNNDLKINVDSIDEAYLMTGFQKIANRLTLGLIVAATIISAALIMPIETPFKLFGYPGLAMILFIMAGVGGLVLAINIIMLDERTDRRN